MNTAQKIAKESTISFIGIFYGSINRYLYSALLARWVGPEYLGIYSMANAIMLIGEVLSKMGMETGTMRFISRMDPKKDQKEISRIIALIWTIILMLVAILFNNVDNSLIIIGLKIASFTYGVLLSFFILSKLGKFSTSNIIIGYICGIITVFIFVKFNRI